MNVASLLTRPTYDGKSDLKRYIKHARQYVKDMRIRKSRTAVEQLRLGLTGDAKDILDGYKDGELRTVDKMFKILRVHCSSNVRAGSKLYQIKQGADESCSSFLARIRKYVILSGVRSKRHVEQMCIDYLSNGAHKHIRTRLINRSPKTFKRSYFLIAIQNIFCVTSLT